MADITVVGGINIDIEGSPYGALIPADSNPGQVAISFGGVGRNIVENLARLGSSVAMVSLTGDDFMGTSARQQLAELGADVEQILRVEGEKTGMYLSILNQNNDMELAICNMDILERMTPAFIQARESLLNGSRIVAVDCNLQLETLDYMTRTLDVPIFLDPVSVSKAERVKSIIHRFHTIKPNRIEAELLSGMKITDHMSLSACGQWFCSQGVKRVFISLGAEGAYYRTEDEEGIVPTQATTVVSATGAGDAFSAAILLGHVEGLTARETAQLGMCCSAIALESQTAVNPQMSMERVRKQRLFDQKQTPASVYELR